AAEVAHLASMWDGGDDWPTGSVAVIDPASPPAAEWAARLIRTDNNAQSPTVLEAKLLWNIREVDTGGFLLHDPATDLPVVHRTDYLDKKRLFAAVPQRIQTTAALAAVTLADGIVWIRTADGQLWLAPERPSHGLNWGYSGGGPYELALMLA